MPTLREFRKQNHLTQEALAQKASIARETVSRIENGVEKPSISSVRAMAKALKVKPVEIEFLGK